ncbi:hypothetical protein [Frondihabitans australicus]|uniref:Uncharacterized protein n=1 Tax=Frondihabitans australicus TaxID=386892 RepID=A0A495IHK6_9MICO|nr:hypothetical protein [Frondihabitans australicus]RKR75180.1 hypothetical protein C8E83_2318 [Frondihabitans australicus]
MTDTATAPAGSGPASDWRAGEERHPIESTGWSLEVIDASLDHISYRGTRILRALRVIVRDRDWRTVPAVLDALETTVDGAATVVTLRAHHDDLGARAHWTATLRLDQGRLDLSVDLGVDSDFLRNRIGIVALHPTDLASIPLAVTHPDASTTSTVFPVEISPHQPAVDIAGLAWHTGVFDVALRFEGDVFEMEDQRNWTDASYKTYSTPLGLPFPVDVGPGDAVGQSVTVTVAPGGAADPAPVASEHGIVADAARVPSVTVGAATAPGTPGARPAWLHGAGVLVELDLRDPGWTRALARARRDAGSSPLDVRLIAVDPSQLDHAVAALCGVPVARLAVFDAARHITTAPLWERLRDLATREPVLGLLVGGTRGHFTELNRTHAELPRDVGGVTFSITPQMHDLSTDQVVESLVEQRRVALQASRIADGRPVHVGPVTLRARFNAVATSPWAAGPADVDAFGYGAEHVWNSTDPRQGSDEYATWLLASFVALSTGAVESVALAEAWGPRGFGSVDGVPAPAASVLAWLVEVQGAPVVALDAAALPDGVFALAARLASGTVLLVANTSQAPVSFSLLGAPVSLAPFARARLLLP